MIIKSQDEKKLVVLESVGQIYIVYKPMSTIVCAFGNGDTIELGEYNNEERCKKVIADLLNSYQRIKEYEITGKAVFQPEYVYRMPYA